MSKTIVFFGTDEFSAVSLRALIASGFSIGAVVTKPDSRKGRGRELSKPIVKQIAEAHTIPVLQPLSSDEMKSSLEAIISEGGQSPIGILVSYGKIIPQTIIHLFEPGIVNVHPSLLPQYRGPSPIETAILNGDAETGVTIMQLSAQMDAGPIYSQVHYSLTGTETGAQLEQTLAELGADSLVRTLPDIINGNLRPTPQNDADATYCQLLTKDDSTLDTSTLSAEQAERKIRAHLAFPKTKTIVLEQPIVITKAHATDKASTALDIECSDGRFLSIDELIRPSGKAMDASAFLNGYAGLK